MTGMKRLFCFCAGSTGVVLAGLCLVVTPVFAQYSSAPGAEPAVSYAASRVPGGFDKLRLLPPGGAVPRTAGGHPDLTGRWYPNRAGKMLQGGYQIDDSIMRQFDPKVTPQEQPVFTAEGLKHKNPPFPYGS